MTFDDAWMILGRIVDDNSVIFGAKNINKYGQIRFMTQAMTSKRCASIAVPKQLHSDSASGNEGKSHFSAFRAVGKAAIYCKCPCILCTCNLCVM